MENELENREYYNASDMSVTKVTKDVLFMVRSYRSVFGNQWGAYFFMPVLVFLLICYSIAIYYSIVIMGNPIWNPTFINIVAISIPILFFLIVVIPWRRDLPICINKKTGVVSVWTKGELAQITKEELLLFRSEFRAGRSILRGAAFFLNGVVSKKRIKVLIIEEVDFLWLEKLIYDFLDGKEITFDEYTLNKIKRGNFELSIKKLFVLRFIDSYYAFSKWEKILLYPFYFLYSIFIGFPTDLLMYGLNKILPRRKIPKELLEACGCKDGEKVYG